MRRPVVLFLAMSFLLWPLGAHAQGVIINTVAGGAVPANGPALLTFLGPVTAVTEDGSGNIYLISPVGYAYKLDTSGNLTVIAGNGTGGYTGDGALATAATLNRPQGIAVDTLGNVYIADTGNNVIRKIDHSTLFISTVAGNGTRGSCGNNVSPTSCGLNQPQGVFVDGGNNIFIADSKNHQIREVVFSSGNIITVAGNGFQGFFGDSGPATSANLDTPNAVGVDGSGNIFFADTNNQRIREVSGGNIDTVAGSGPFGGGSGSFSGDGLSATLATLNQPTGVFVDSMGHIFIADTNNNVIREVSGGIINTVAGDQVNALAGFSGDAGPALSAFLSEPFSVFLETSGKILIADSVNRRLRQVDTSLNISTIAGNGVIGDGGFPTSASLALPFGVATDAQGNLYIGDYANDVVREIPAATQIIITAAGTGIPGSAGGGGAATATELNFPQGLAADSGGNVYIADSQNFAVRELSTGGTLSTRAGTLGTAGFTLTGGPLASTPITNVEGVAVAANGFVYIADPNAHAVWKATGSTLSVFAGSPGVPGFGGDGMAANSFDITLLNGPTGVALDTTGNVYIADTKNDRIRMVDTLGIIHTFAGNGTRGFGGDGSLATSAALNRPEGVAVDSMGNVYIADTENNVVREVYCPNVMLTCFVPTPFAANDINTVAGNASLVNPVTGAPFPGFFGDNGAATSAQLSSPTGLFLDAANNFYIADTANSRIRIVGAAGPVASIMPTSFTLPSTAVGGFNFMSGTLTNTGTAPLQISSATITGTNSGDFNVSGCFGTLAPGANCMFTITLRPSITGPLSATLVFIDNAPGSPQMIPLMGTGTAPTIICTKNWVGTSGADWAALPTNWSPPGFPGITDDVCINAGISVTISTGTQAIRSLTDQGLLIINGGTLSVVDNSVLHDVALSAGTISNTPSAQIAINGTFTWTGGTIGGTGANGVLAAGPVLINGGGVILDTVPLQFQGRATMSGATASLTVTNNGRVLILQSGVLDLQNDQGILLGAGTTNSLPVLNFGTIMRSVSAGTATIGVGINNATGILSVISGGLTLAGQLASISTIAVSPGATLNLMGFSAIAGVFGGPGGTTAGGTVNMQSGGGGSMVLSSLTPTSSVLSTLNVSAPVTLNNTTLSVATINLLASTFTGSGTIVGNVVGTAGTLNVTNPVSPGNGAGVLTIKGNYTQSAPGGLIVTLGGLAPGTGYSQLLVTGTVMAGGAFQAAVTTGFFPTAAVGQKFTVIQAGSVIGGFSPTSATGLPGGLAISLGTNMPPGTAVVTITSTSGACTVTYTGASGGSWGTASNWSTAVLPGATDNVCLGTNSVVLSAALPAGNQSVSSITATGGTLTISGGALTVANATSSPSMLSDLNVNGGTITFNSPATTASATLAVGTLTGSSTFTVSGILTWTGGTMSGTGTTTVNGGIAMSGAAVTLDTRTMISNGTTTVSGATASLILSNGAVFNNTASAVYDIQNSTATFGAIFVGAGAAPMFNNLGTLRRSTSAALMQIQAPVTSTGTISVTAGVLALLGNSTIGGTATISPGATLALQNSTFNVTAAITGTGSGGLSLAGGPAAAFNFNAGSSVNLPTPIVLSGGTMTIASGVTITASLTLSSGTLQGNGTLNGALSQMSGTTVHPGTSPGILTITGNYTQNSGATLAVDLGGLTAGTQYSQLVVSGSAFLGGTLVATLFGPFTPVAGNSFTLILPGSVASTFTSPTLPPPPSGSTWNITYNSAANGGVVLAASSSACTVTYTGASGGSWGTGTNWSSGAVPGNNDDVCITGLSVDVPALAAANQGIHSLTTSGAGALSFDTGPLSVSAASSLGQGFIMNGGTITFLGNVSFGGAVTLNAGTAIFGNGATATTATFAGAVTGAAAAALTFGGQAATTFSGAFNNAGTTTIMQTAVVNFSGSSTNLGTLNIPANGTANFNAATNLTGIGTLTITGGGTANFSSSNSLVPVTSISVNLGTITGNNGITVSGASTFNGATLSGAGTFTANGLATFGPGANTIDTRTFVANGGATLTGSALLTLANGAVFNNAATSLLDVQSTGGFGPGAGALGTLVSAGTIQRSSSTGSAFLDVGLNLSGPINVNTGTLNIDGTGTVTSAITVASGATLGLGANVGPGPLNLTAASSVSGAGSVDFRLGTVNVAGNYNISGGTSVVSTGTYNFTGPVTSTGPITAPSGILNFSSSSPSVPIASINQSGANIIGSSNLTVAGVFNWSLGMIGGTGTLTANGGVNINGGIAVLDTKTLMAASHVVQSSSATLRLENGAVFILNAGNTFDMQSVLGIITGTTGAFNNLGIFQRSGSAGGATPIGVPFNNIGTVNVLLQELDFNAGGTCAPALSCSGSFNLSPGAILGFNGGTFNLGGSLTGSGNVNALGGTLNFSSGASASGVSALFVGNTTSIASGVNLGIASVTVFSGGTLRGTGMITGNVTNSGGTVHPGASPGILTITGNYMQTAGALAVEIASTTLGSGYSQLVVNGMATLGGTLSLIQVGGFAPPPGSNFIIVLATSVSGTFLAINTGTFPVSPALSISTYSPAPTGVVLTAAAAGACTKTFNVASGTYETAGNWTPAGIPVGTDMVCIPAPNSASLNSVRTAGGLALDGTLTINSGFSLTVNGTTTISSTGTLTGVGASATYTSGGTFNLNGGKITGTVNVTGNSGTTVNLNGGTIDGAGGMVGSIAEVGSNGTMNLTASTTVQNGGILISFIGSTMNISDGVSLLNGPGTTQVFNNSGTLNKLAGTAGSVIAVNLSSFGPINLNGALSILGGGLSVSTITIPAGSTLTIGGGAGINFSLGGSVTGGGTLSFPSATTSITNATINVTGATTFSGGSVTFGAGTTVTKMGTATITSGTLLFGPTTTGILGPLNVNGGLATIVTGQPAGVSLASVTVNSGQLTLVDNITTNVTINGGLLLGSAVINGDVALFSGFLQGAQTINGNLTNSAGTVVVGPGVTTAGILIVNGTFGQSSSGTISFQFMGTAVGAGGYSQLQVNGGNASIGGQAVARNDHGFVFASGQTFTAVQTGTPGVVVGVFGGSTLPALAAGLSWTVSTGPTSVTYNVGGGAVPDFSLSSASSTLTVAAGGSVSDMLTVSPLNGFTGNVLLALSGFPSGATSSFTPPTISGGSGTSSLSITTLNTTPPGSYPLTITGASVALSHTVSVTLIVNPPPAPAVSLSATTLGFGAIAVGSSSSPMTVTLTNSGTAALNLMTVTITGANAGDFSPPAAGTTCTNNTTVGFTPPANTCVINIIFTPTATGTRIATITITDNAATSPQTVALTGGGPGFTLTAPPTPSGGPGNQVTLLPGDTGQFTLVLTLNPGFGPVTLACGTPLPPHTICTISPSTIPMNTGTMPIMITITVKLQTNCVTGLLAPRGPGSGPGPIPPAPLAALWLSTLLLLAVIRRYLPQGWALRLTPALVLLLLVVTWTGCVSNPPAILPGQPQTPPGNYTLPITATSSSGTQTLMLMVRVI
jgi:hypothetical protein